MEALGQLSGGFCDQNTGYITIHFMVTRFFRAVDSTLTNFRINYDNL